MSLTAFSPLANHLWQSTLFACAIGLLTLALRGNRAQVRYALWLFASLKFLIPFGVLISLGSQISVKSSMSGVQPDMAIVIDTISQPFATSAAPLSAPTVAVPTLATALPVILVWVWAFGCAVNLVAWSVRWRRIRRLIRNGRRVDESAVLEILRRLEGVVGTRLSTALVMSDAALEPGVFGIFSPVLVWPRRLSESLTVEQTEAIVAHELCHVRRRDNLAAAVHMVVDAMFWFHPLVWWLETRLVDERERACDEAVLGMGSDPQLYAESILKTCQFCVESPLVCVSGVTGSDSSRSASK